MQLRPLTSADRSEFAELIYVSFNTWYRLHGQPDIFRGGPEVAELFFDVYDELDPGFSVAAVHPNSRRLMGTCFYHPREHHVSLGVMAVHPNHSGRGVGSALLRHIIDFTDRRGAPLRLTQSAINVDSFSLYNKAGFVPRYAYQDMLLNVPESGWTKLAPGHERVRPARADDVPAMARLEFEVSGITREPDYRYCIANRLGCFHVSVIEGPHPGELDGFLIASSHAASEMLGPGVMRSEGDALALLSVELDRHRGKMPIVVAPVEKQQLVRALYGWGARVCEMHFCQVRGPFQPFAGVNLPAFLPETG